MTNRLVTFVAGLALSFSMATPSRAEDTKLTVMVFRGGQNLPLFAAQTKGFLAKRGLSVEVKFASSAAELPIGLADGRWQIIHSTADNAVGMSNVISSTLRW
jgi:ABC-type nitrate/sulfonate/bicarbonate transport system substrate-binding protein